MRTLMQLELEKKAFRLESTGVPGCSEEQGNHIGDGILGGYVTPIVDGGEGFVARPRDCPDSPASRVPDELRQEVLETPVLDFHGAGGEPLGINDKHVMEYIVEDSEGGTDVVKMNEVVRFNDVAGEVLEIAEENCQENRNSTHHHHHHPYDDDLVQISEDGDTDSGKGSFETADIDQKSRPSVDELACKENTNHSDAEEVAAHRGIGGDTPVDFGPTVSDRIGVGNEIPTEPPPLSP